MELSFSSGIIIGLLFGWIVSTLIDAHYWKREVLRQRRADIDWRTQHSNGSLLTKDVLAHRKTAERQMRVVTDEALSTLQTQLYADQGFLAKHHLDLSSALARHDQIMSSRRHKLITKRAEKRDNTEIWALRNARQSKSERLSSSAA